MMQGAANVLNEFLSQGVIVQESDGAFTIPSANYSINQEVQQQRFNIWMHEKLISYLVIASERIIRITRESKNRRSKEVIVTFDSSVIKTAACWDYQEEIFFMLSYI